MKNHLQGIFKESYKSDKNKYMWGFLPLFIFAGDRGSSRNDKFWEL